MGKSTKKAGSKGIIEGFFGWLVESGEKVRKYNEKKRKRDLVRFREEAELEKSRLELEKIRAEKQSIKDKAYKDKWSGLFKDSNDSLFYNNKDRRL